MSVNCLNHAYQRRIADRIERLECIEPWDERPSGVLLEDVQAALFACACHHARNCGRLAQSLSDQASILHATGLARGRFLTNSGAVLFSDANEPLVSCRLFSGARHDGLIDSASHFSPYVCALEGALFFIMGHCRNAFGVLLDSEPAFAAWLRSAAGSLLSYAFLYRPYEARSAVRVSMEPGRLFVSFPREQVSTRFGGASFRSSEEFCADELSNVAGRAELFSCENALLAQNAYRFGFLDGGLLDCPSLVRKCCEWGFSLDVQEGARETGLLLARRATRVS